MNLTRSDYDQAARYLQSACDLMDRQAPGKMRATYNVLQLAIRRLSPGDHFAGDAAAEITVLRQAAETVPWRTPGRRFSRLSRFFGTEPRPARTQAGKELPYEPIPSVSYALQGNVKAKKSDENHEDCEVELHTGSSVGGPNYLHRRSG